MNYMNLDVAVIQHFRGQVTY